MREIDRIMWKAFVEWKAISKSNTSVVNYNWKVCLTLHWNEIVARPEDDLNNLTMYIPVRWQTQTTKNRLNWVLEALWFPIEIKAIRTIWYFVNTIDNTKTAVVPWTNFIHK